MTDEHSLRLRYLWLNLLQAEEQYADIKKCMLLYANDKEAIRDLENEAQHCVRHILVLKQCIRLNCKEENEYVKKLSTIR